jgi:hypothetical protein
MRIKRPPKLTNRSSLVKFVEVDLWSWLRELANGTLKINFNDNFQGFIVEDLKIPATTEIQIYNQFRTTYPGKIPSGRIIVRQKGNANIIDGQEPWTADFVYLLNPSANEAVITVFFYM